MECATQTIVRILALNNSKWCMMKKIVRSYHDNVIKWKLLPCYWPFVRGIHRSLMNCPHKGQWRGYLMFPLICARTNGWVNNRDVGDLGRHSAHYDIIVMRCVFVESSVYTKCVFGGGGGGGGGDGGWWWLLDMMQVDVILTGRIDKKLLMGTPWHEHILRITGSFCGQSTSHPWIPPSQRFVAVLSVSVSNNYFICMTCILRSINTVIRLLETIASRN